MKISFSGVWDDTVRLLRANASLFIAVAGVFLFLPSLILGYVAPQPTGGAGSPDGTALANYFADHWEWLLLVNVIGFVGSLALLILALDQSRPTVGGAIRGAFVLLPTYFLTGLFSFALIGFASIFLILPGLYLFGRLATAGPVIVAENRRNPFDAIGRSFAITKGNGWANLGLILIVVITFWVLSMAATVVFGSIFLLLVRTAGIGGVGALLLLILQGLIGATFNVVLILLLASLYRRLVQAQPSTSGI
jgi:hypothetical protein